MTPNKEDYLKCIYEIGTEEGKISNKEIANRMQVSPPAVTEMIKKLISEDLIIKDKVKGYLLTKTGKINVAELYRKHRLIEVFLVDHLQYTCDLIHQDVLRRVQDQIDLLHYLKTVGLKIGTPFTFEGFDPFTLLYRLNIDGKEIQIPETVASNLYIESN